MAESKDSRAKKKKKDADHASPPPSADERPPPVAVSWLGRRWAVLSGGGGGGASGVASSNPWSNATLDQIPCVLDCVRDEKVHVYWLYPGKQLFDGFLPLVTGTDLIELRSAPQIDKSLVIFVDHTNFIRLIRADLVKARAAIARPRSANATSIARPEPIDGVQASVSKVAASTSIVVAQGYGEECIQSQGDHSDSDNSNDSEFYDSDFDAE
ncbi:hypothetical protein ACQ4PT_050986 [Festuca glaucescens]